MAMQQLTLPGEIVKKHNKLVRSRINTANKITSRILACLVAAIRHDDTGFKDAYSVPIKDYLPPDENEKGGSQYKLVKAACRKLVEATVEWEWPDPDEPEGDPIFLVMPFFSSARFRKGIVTAEFNPKLADYLLQLHACFTQYSLLEYLRLPSLYSQRIFEILKSWSGKPEVVLPIAELHRLLDTPPSFRADFKAFRVYVLEKAHKDILAKTSLRYEWEPVKVGRSVESVRFIFGPGRKALAEAEKQKAKDEKKRRIEKNRWQRAYHCALGKGGVCKQDNKPVICKTCLKLDFCAGLLAKTPA